MKCAEKKSSARTDVKASRWKLSSKLCFCNFLCIYWVGVSWL